MQTGSHYRLYFLDVDGHIMRAKDLRCAGDSEAVRLAYNHPRDHAMELWQGDKRLHSLGALPVDQPSEYVVYLLKEDHIVGLTTIDAPTDISACAIASHIFHGCDDECDAFEVWQRGYWIQAQIHAQIEESTNSVSSASDLFDMRLAALERRHQNLVVEREIQLCDSYAAIRKSRKLLDTVSELKPLFGLF